MYMDLIWWACVCRSINNQQESELSSSFKHTYSSNLTARARPTKSALLIDRVLCRRRRRARRFSDGRNHMKNRGSRDIWSDRGIVASANLCVILCGTSPFDVQSQIYLMHTVHTNIMTSIRSVINIPTNQRVIHRPQRR